MIIYGIKDLKTDKVVLPVFSDDIRSVNSTIINMIAKNPGNNLELYASDYIVIKIGELLDDGTLYQGKVETEGTVSDLLPLSYRLRESIMKKEEKEEVKEDELQE